MNNSRQFDEHINEQFNNYSPDVPMHIWEKIMAEKDKKRPAGFWMSFFNSRNNLLILGLIITISSGGTWFYFNKNKPLNPIQSNFENINIDKKMDAGPGISETALTPKQQINSTDLNSNPPLAADHQAANSNPALLSAGNIKANIVSPSFQQDDDKYMTPLTNKGHKKRYTGLAAILVNTTIPDLVEDEFEGQGTLLGRLSFNAEQITVKRKTEQSGTLRFNPIVFLPDCPTHEKNTAGNKKYIEFFTGPDYAFRSLQDTGNSDYLQKRKESTNFKSGFSAGMRFTKVFNNSMSVRAGINYSQINEKFTFNQGNIIQVTYIINTNGDTIGSYSTTGSRYKTTINRFRSIDIPIVMGYEIGNGKLHANINAGAVVNIYSWQKGDVLDRAGNPVSITTGKNASPYQFKTNAGIGFIAAVSVYYKLNDKLHIMAEPYFRYNISPINKEGITLKQKYQTAGLRLGIRLDLK